MAALAMDKKKPSNNACHMAALEALGLGLSVIPVGGDKRPLVKWQQYQSRLATEDEVAAWFQRRPDANIGIVTGAVSGLAVIDFDPGHDPWPAEGHELPADVVVRTPRGGSHHYVKHVPGVRNSASKVAKGVDVRAEGGYVLIPPSAVGDRDYSFVTGGLAEIAALRDGADPPTWLVEALVGDGDGGRRRTEDGQDGDPAPPAGARQPIRDGVRNDSLFRLACSWRRAGLDRDEIMILLRQRNAQQCVAADGQQPAPLDDDELEKIAESASKYEEAADEPPPTDTGNARRLVGLHGDDFRYVESRKAFYIWGNISAD